MCQVYRSPAGARERAIIALRFVGGLTQEQIGRHLGVSQMQADRPADRPKASWVKVLRRAVGQIKGDELTDRAAALTYYGVQAIFPGLLVLVSILGLDAPSGPPWGAGTNP